MGNMLRQIVAPLHELGLARDPFLPVSQLIDTLRSCNDLVLCHLARYFCHDSKAYPTWDMAADVCAWP